MPYISLSGTLRLVTIYYLASYLAVCLEVITDIRDRSRDRILVDVCASVLMLTAGVFSAYKAGLLGVLGIGILAQLVRSGTYIFLLTKPLSHLNVSLPEGALGAGEL